MRDFLDEFKYMCSSANTKSRGFYLMIAVMLIILTLCLVVGATALVWTIVKGWFQVYFAVLWLIAMGIEVGVIVWLKKS